MDELNEIDNNANLDDLINSQNNCTRITFACLILIAAFIDFCFFEDYVTALTTVQMIAVAFFTVSLSISSLLKIYVAYAHKPRFGMMLTVIVILLGVCQFPLRLIFMVKASAHPGLVAIGGPLLFISLFSMLEICVAWRRALINQRKYISKGKGKGKGKGKHGEEGDNTTTNNNTNNNSHLMKLIGEQNMNIGSLEERIRRLEKAAGYKQNIGGSTMGSGNTETNAYCRVFPPALYAVQNSITKGYNDMYEIAKAPGPPE